MADTDLGTCSLGMEGTHIDRDLLAVLTRELFVTKLFCCLLGTLNLNYLVDMIVVMTSRPIGMIFSILPRNSNGA